MKAINSINLIPMYNYVNKTQTYAEKGLRKWYKRQAQWRTPKNALFTHMLTKFRHRNVVGTCVLSYICQFLDRALPKYSTNSGPDRSRSRISIKLCNRVT